MMTMTITPIEESLSLLLNQKTKLDLATENKFVIGEAYFGGVKLLANTLFFSNIIKNEEEADLAARNFAHCVNELSSNNQLGGHLCKFSMYRLAKISEVDEDQWAVFMFVTVPANDHEKLYQKYHKYGTQLEGFVGGTPYRP